MAEKNQRIGLPVPGTPLWRRAAGPSPGPHPSWSGALLTASVDLIAISLHLSFHAATLTRPGPRAGRVNAGSDGLGS